MKNAKKLVAAVAAATMAMTSLAATSIFASAYDYNDYYNTYRFYAEVSPRSGIKRVNMTTSYPRAYTRLLNFENAIIGDFSGTYSLSGTAGDYWATRVDIFEANAPLTTSGLLFKWEVYTNLAVSTVEDIFNKPGVNAWDINGNSVSSSFVTISIVQVGDVNEDNVVNGTDLELLKKHVLGIESLYGNKYLAADINNDGELNSLDVLQLNKYINGTIDHF